MVASEIRRPQRNLPLALVWGTASVIGIYLLANIAYFYVLTPQEVAGSNRVAAAMMRQVLGQGGANVVSIAAMISIFAALNGSISFGRPRSIRPGPRGYFFSPVGRVALPITRLA